MVRREWRFRCFESSPPFSNETRGGTKTRLCRFAGEWSLGLGNGEFGRPEISQVPTRSRQTDGVSANNCSLYVSAGVKRSRTNLPAVEAEVASPQQGGPQVINGNGELVLLVDDETNIRRVTKVALENHNYRVLEANDGPEALAVFAQHMDSVNVVLTDMMMPYIDGIAVIRALKKMKPDMIFIASTGQDDEPRLAELQELGVANFLSKPYDTRNLLTVLESAVSTHSAPLPKK